MGTDLNVPKTPDEEKFELEYPIVKDFIIHYSTVRSALTAFLITVSLTAFGGYFQSKHPAHTFLAVAGFILLIIARLVCSHFSKRTETAHLYLEKLWDWKWGKKDESKPNNERLGYPGDPGGFMEYWKKVSASELQQKMNDDKMNPLMTWLVIIIGLLFLGFNFHDQFCGGPSNDQSSHKKGCWEKRCRSQQTCEKSEAASGHAGCRFMPGNSTNIIQMVWPPMTNWPSAVTNFSVISNYVTAAVIFTNQLPTNLNANVMVTNFITINPVTISPNGTNQSLSRRDKSFNLNVLGIQLKPEPATSR